MHRLLKLIFVLLLVSTKVLAQCPPNIGFEDGTFKNWECYAGEITREGVIDVVNTGEVYSRHTIISDGRLDYYGGFPAVCPNGSKFSVRLGNSDTVHKAERISYTYTVPPGAEHSLVLNYAVVLQNPPHEPYEQPKFTATVYDVTDGKYIDCPQFNFIASSSLHGFKLSPVVAATGTRGPASIYYKDWSATTINLVGYAGKVIRLEFTTNDCSLGGHFGYAYLDLNEECKQPITGNTYCAGQTSITLHAPRGFLGYKWYNADQTVLLGTGQSLKLNPAPPDQTKYVLQIENFPGLGCPDILTTVITQIPNEFSFKVTPVVWGCPGVGADITAPSVTAGSSSNLLPFNYYTHPDSLTYLRNPYAITTPGIYYIEATNPEGCTNILPVEVRMRDAAVIVVKDPPPAQYPATVDLANVFIHKSDQTYTYFNKKDSTTLILDHTASVSGTYGIRAINQWGCEVIGYVQVTINPPPTYKITGPTAFTPNADGVNDNFMVTVNGFVTFGDLKIYNRYGKLVFTAKSLNEYWNGTYKGYLLPVGSYYWVFNGEDFYNHVPVVKSGAIAIVR